MENVQQALIGKYAMGAPLVVKSMALFPEIHTNKDHIHLCGFGMRVSLAQGLSKDNNAGSKFQIVLTGGFHISKALAGADRKDLMRKLPKFIYDEEKALEKTRKILTDKIAQLNSAIDDVSAQLRADDAPNGSAVNPDEIEASI
ncbi:hypothetical protein PVL29_027110 [Vitis rotundifolia]|uniref:Uncharacterized protein n=1 Tax=Vitis rotundifolia TaxID=103349 RepID=A0AA39D6G5_VITRO|nr:hypothetical protein PVL29_027110 [Vitis rotundifolia]